MRLLVLFMCGFALSISAKTFAQQEKVNLNLRDVAVKVLLDEIQQQTGLHFIFNTEQMSRLEKLSVQAQNETVCSVLERVFKNTGYECQFRDGIIMIRRKGEAEEAPQIKQMKITGVVRDKQGQVLPGVSVLILNTTLGCATDVNGEFSMSVPEQEKLTLYFSFIGMKPLELPYIKGQGPLKITLEESVAKLEEIVVTGYQQIEKRNLTSSVVTVKTSELKTIGSSSIEQMLQGVVPGLSVINTSASPGAAPKIRIRGSSTISGNAEPLWVLDGVILENSVPVSAADLNSPDVMNMFNSVIGGINPTDIETITVLKDASATAIYGTRAANGVIVVTTKKGKRNSFNISYQHTSMVSIRPGYDDFDLLNSKERIELTRQYTEDGLWVSGHCGLEGLLNQYAMGNISMEAMNREARKMEARNTDWFKILFRNAYTQTHNLSVSGGTEKTTYYVSLSYNGEQGVDRSTDYKNYNGMLKVNTELFKGINLGTLLQISRRDRNSYNSDAIDPFAYAVKTSRVIPLHNEDGSLYYYKQIDAEGLQFNVQNELNNTYSGNTETDVKGIVDLDVKLYKGLKYSGLFSYSSSHYIDNNYATQYSAHVSAIRGYDYGNTENKQMVEKTELPFGGVFNETTYEQRTSLIRNSLSYQGNLAEDLSVDVMVGQEFRTTNYKGLTTNTFGYYLDRGNTFYEPVLGNESGHLKRNKVARSLVKRSNISYYGVASVMFKNRYVINANIRFDGSNLFGSNPKYRYLPLWSVSAKWTISNENFLLEAGWLSYLALRGSYGLRGNIVEDSSPQIIASALPPNPNTGLLELEVLQAPDKNLKWETTSSVNIGLELGLFDNRLNLEMDYYKDKSRDLVAYRDVSAVTGFMGHNVNYADARNLGIDISLTGSIIRTDAWDWMLGVNLGYVNNKVTKSYVTPQAKNLVKSTYTPGEVMQGLPMNAMFSYRFAGLDEEGAPTFYNRDNKVIRGMDSEFMNIPTDVNNLKYEGERDPILTGGINTNLRYKNLSISMLFSFGLKNVIRLPQLAYSAYPNGEENANRSIMDRWRPGQDNTGKTIPRLSEGDSWVTIGSEDFYLSDMFNKSQESVVPGDYLRFRNLMMEYQLPQRWLDKVSFDGKSLVNVSLKFQAQNLFVLADKRLKGYDPETINYTTTGYGSLPLPRTFTFGLNINF